MDLKILFTSILSTIEIFFSSTAGIMFAYSFFRTHKAAKKEYKESSRGSLSIRPSYDVYEEEGKYYVADMVQHANSEEISEEDYLSYQEYEKYDYGLERTSLQVRKDHILALSAVIFIFVSSCISINKVTQSLFYAVLVDCIYIIAGIGVVILIKAVVDKINVKEPSIPKSIKEYEEKYYIIKQGTLR